MKVSLNWAQELSNVDLLSIPKEQLLKKVGAQLGAIEDVIDYGARYEGIVVVRVMTCEPHPNADKLHVCRVNDGGVIAGIERDDDNNVQVVCGAPNVRAGMLAVWLPPGTTVPSTFEKDPFVLGARDLRGIVSNGMLASPAELALNDDHDGILEILASDVSEALAQPGVAFKKLYGLDDTIIDLENKMFTHRPDCFGILGVARELAGISGQKFISPQWYSVTPQFKNANDLPLKVAVKSPLVPRFMAVVLDNVSVGKSPIAMQSALTRVGIRPINTAVDITNWLMHATGQPLHAYDYDKVKALCGNEVTIQARMGTGEESLTLLNGKQIKPDKNTIVIATDKQAIGLAGVMGGLDTEVDETTKRIIIEVATFDMYAIRKTAMKYGVFTDAVTRFTKGQSALQNDRVLSEAIRLIHELCSATQASAVFDIKDAHVEPMAEVRTTVDFINDRLGSQLTRDEAVQLLANVECAETVSSASEMRSYLMGVGDIDQKLERIGVQIIEKTSNGHYKLIVPNGAESDYEKLVSWEMKPGYWCEYIGAKNVFLFKSLDTKVSRYELKTDTEHEIVEMCRSFANEYYTSLDAMLQGNTWYKPLLPLKLHRDIEQYDANDIRVSPPFWRTDIALQEDLVEEVGRLYGFDRITVELPVRMAIPIKKNSVMEYNSLIRTIMESAGANELLTYSFVHGDLLKKVRQDPANAFHIRNALSPDLQYYRLSLTPSLLEKLYINAKAGYTDCALFEIGKAHTKNEELQKDEVPKEHRLLAAVVTKKTKQNSSSPYYYARAYVDYVVTTLGLRCTYEPIDNPIKSEIAKPFELQRSAIVRLAGSDELLGIVGEYTDDIMRYLKLPNYTAGFELNLDILYEAMQNKQTTYIPLIKFPKIEQDITLEVPQKVLFSQLYSNIEQTLQQQQSEHGYMYELSHGDIFVPEESEKRRISFKVTMCHPNKTLTMTEANTLLDEVSRRAVAAFAAIRV